MLEYSIVFISLFIVSLPSCLVSSHFLSFPEEKRREKKIKEGKRTEKNTKEGKRRKKRRKERRRKANQSKSKQETRSNTTTKKSNDNPF